MGNDRDNGDNISTRLTYFLVGGGIGTVLALLFAPKSGEELRNDIADATRKGIDKSRETAQQLGAKASEYYDATREKAGEYYEATRDRASDLYQTATNKAGEAAAAAREAATRQPSSRQPTIEAGNDEDREKERRNRACTPPSDCPPQRPPQTGSK